MKEGLVYREQLLFDLKENVVRAADFFMRVDEDLFDGHQSAREVLSHLVFWHQAYCTISKALLLNEEPPLLAGPLAELNEHATCIFRDQEMCALARILLEAQDILECNLRKLPDWNINFPFKKGCRKIDVAGRICAIRNHIHHHLVRQERAYQRGEDWVRAYYLDPAT